jgi:hypothetical protein
VLGAGCNRRRFRDGVAEHRQEEKKSARLAPLRVLVLRSEVLICT